MNWDWAEIDVERAGVRKAWANLHNTKELAQYVVHRLTAYVGPHHAEVAVEVLTEALDAARGEGEA